MFGSYRTLVKEKNKIGGKKNLYLLQNIAFIKQTIFPTQYHRNKILDVGCYEVVYLGDCRP